MERRSGGDGLMTNLDVFNSVGGEITEASRTENRDKILRLQGEMLEMENIVGECEVKHIFAPGVYAREMTIPKGIVIIGKIHKHRHVNIISKGSAEVMTEFGKVHIQAPCTFVSEVGTKRAVLALEDVVWTTIHPTNETDLAKIEDEVIAKSYDEIVSLGCADAPKLKGGTL